MRDGPVWNSVPDVQNVVPALPDRVEETLADRAVADRRAAYAAEARRLIDAAFVVMRREGSIDPQVRAIVQEAGLSNQAFYRHFPSKDALLLAVLADGQRQLVAYLARRVARDVEPDRTGAALDRGRDGAGAQPRRGRSDASVRVQQRAARRPLPRRPRGEPGRDARVAHARGASRSAEPRDDAELVRDLALARMNDAIAHRRIPSRAEMQRLVDFCLAGITGTR